MSFSQNWITVIVFLLLILLSNLSVLQAAQTAAQTQRDQSREEIAVKASLSATLTHVGENVRFWLTIRSLAPQGISQLRFVQLRAHGYKIASLSWCPKEKEDYQQGSKGGIVSPSEVSELNVPPKCILIADALKPGQSITVWGDLHAQERHHKQTLVAVLSWVNTQKIESRVAAPIGELQATWWWTEPLSYLINLIKDFALPILLGLLAFLYQRLDKAREQARLEQEKTREQIRQEQDRLRTQIAETWSKMLPESHRLATHYYMPIEAALRGALQFLEAQQTESQQRAFFYLVLFERRMRHLINSAGGFYFKDRVGETLTIRCYQEYRKLYYYDDNEKLKRLGTMLDHIRVSETWASFSKKFTESGTAKQNLDDGWKDFKEWLDSGNCGRAMPYLKAFRAVLSYEMNRPYEHWYGRREKIELDQGIESTILEIAKRIQSEGPTSDFIVKVQEYLANAKA